MVPEPSGDQITHTSAEPAVVPFELMTGELELKPNASLDDPTRLNVGLP